MAINDLYELNVNAILNNNKITNRFVLRDNSGAPSNPEATIMADFVANCEVALLACQSNDIALSGYSCRRVYPTEGATHLLASTSPGTIAQDTEPPQSCAIIQWTTNLHTRRGRGRSHISGVPKSVVKGGLVTAAYVALLEAFAATIVTGLSFTSFCVADVALGSFADVIHFEARTRTYTLRSRRMQQA